MDDNTPAARIKALRKQYALSQEAFAKSIRKSKRQISKVENCDAPLSESMIVAICSVYPVSIEWLIGGDGTIGDSACLDMAQVAEGVKQARLRLGLTQRQFAEALSYSTVQVCSIETKRQQPTLSFLRQIADTFQIRLGWLLYGVGEMGGPLEIMDSEGVADRVKDIRSKAGMTQGQFAAALSCTAVHISGIETRRHKPSNALLKRISDKFHIRYEWLAYGTGTMGDIQIDEDDNAFIGDQLKEIRSHWQLSQAEFAQRIGTTRLMVKYLENGQKAISEDLFETICNLFSISPLWLKTGEGPMSTGEVIQARFTGNRDSSNAHTVYQIDNM